LTGGCHRNRDYLTGKVEVDAGVDPGIVEVAFDPQTSGGLLIALPEAQVELLLRALFEHGVNAAHIGRAVDAGDRSVRLS
jgi:selenide,water dikinase